MSAGQNGGKPKRKERAVPGVPTGLSACVLGGAVVADKSNLAVYIRPSPVRREAWSDEKSWDRRRRGRCHFHVGKLASSWCRQTTSFASHCSTISYGQDRPMLDGALLSLIDG